LRAKKAGNNPETLFSFPGGMIEIVGCVGR
jgi:hypothetical protein